MYNMYKIAVIYLISSLVLFQRYNINKQKSSPGRKKNTGLFFSDISVIRESILSSRADF